MGSQKATQQKSSDKVLCNSSAVNASRLMQQPFSHIQQILRLQRIAGNQSVNALLNSKINLPQQSIACFSLSFCNTVRKQNTKDEKIQTLVQRAEQDEEQPIQGVIYRQPDEEEPLHASSKPETPDKVEKVQTAIQCAEQDEEQPIQGLIYRQSEEKEPVQASSQPGTPDKDEKVQTAIQRAEQDEEQPIQGLIYRQPEEEEPLQASSKPETPDKVEKVQTAIQRAEQDEEQPIQGLIYRQPEEEEPVQGKLQLQPEKDDKINPALQRKLTVGKPDDIYEKEADRVADRVMTMPAQTISMQPEKEDDKIQRTTLSQNITPLVMRETEQDEVAQAAIHCKSSEHQKNSIDNETSSKIQTSQGKGDSLPKDTSDFMESRFGADFSSVKLHTDSQAASVSKQINARAFTLGNDIYFGESQYNPQSHEGKRLLAHELTHTIQQGASPARKVLPVLRRAPAIQRLFGIDLSLKGLLNKVTGYIPGFSLLCLVLGRNPVTDDVVERTPENIIKAILGLIPVIGQILYDNLQKTGAIQKAGAWLSAEINKLGITWEGIKGLFAQAWDRLGITLGIDGNLKILKETFGPIIGRIVTFASSVGGKIKEFVLEAALSLAGGAGQQVMGIINKGKAVFDKILNDPIGFVGNFLKALGQGVSQFASNFLSHFKDAIFGWLFGSFAKAGISLPKKIDLPSIFGFIAEILEVTYNAIKTRIIKALGPKGAEIFAKLEAAFDFVKDLITRGPIALWEKVKDMVGDIKTMIMTEIGAWVSKTIIGKAIEKIVSMCNPVGAIIQAAISIYNTIMFFIERWTQIKEFVDAIFNSINDIAFGNIGKAASYIEKVMSKGIVLLISFLARLIGLGGIVDKIKDVIKKFAGLIGNAIDKVVSWVVKKAKGLLSKIVGFGKKVGGKIKAGVGKLVEWWKARKKFKTSDGENHSIYFNGKDINAKLMVASTEISIEIFLNSNEVNAITDNAFINEHIKPAKNLCKKAYTQTAEIINAEKKNDNAKIDISNNELSKDMNQLAMHIAAIFTKLNHGLTDTKDHPQIGTYSSLSKLNKTNYTPHHVPPKALANWLSRNIHNNSFLTDKANKDKMIDSTIKVSDILDSADNLEKEYKRDGNNLSCILIHQNTHIKKEGEYPNPQWRVHHGEETQKMVGDILKNKGIAPITKGGKLIHPEDKIAYLQAIKDSGEDKTLIGLPSTQMYLTELDAARKKVNLSESKDGDAYLASLRDVFSRAHTQSRAAVEVGLSHSIDQVDGTSDNKSKAISKLLSFAKQTWKEHGGIKKLTGFE